MQGEGANGLVACHVNQCSGLSALSLTISTDEFSLPHAPLPLPLSTHSPLLPPSFSSFPCSLSLSHPPLLPFSLFNLFQPFSQSSSNLLSLSHSCSPPHSLRMCVHTPSSSQCRRMIASSMRCVGKKNWHVKSRETLCIAHRQPNQSRACHCVTHLGIF